MHRYTASLLTACLMAFALPAHAQTALEGDAERGAKLWKKCKACHQIGANANHRVGPVLNEVFDRTAGTIDGFKYSKSMKQAGADGLVWSWQQLDAFLANPKKLIPKTRMSFRGIKDAQERADLITYMRSFSASPRDIPEASPTAPKTDPDIDPAILAINGDKDWGEYLSSECTTCHQEDGADKGIPSITGWPTEIFVIVMHAYKNKDREHPVMQMMASRLSNEEIAALAAYYKGVN